MNEEEKKLAEAYREERELGSAYDVACEVDDANGNRHYFLNGVYVETVLAQR